MSAPTSGGFAVQPPDATVASTASSSQPGPVSDDNAAAAAATASADAEADAASALRSLPVPIVSPMPMTITTTTTTPRLTRNPSIDAIDADDASSQSHPRSTSESQDTAMSAPTDPAVTPPPASDGSGCGAPSQASAAGAEAVPAIQDSQLLQLSEIAAAQDKMATDRWTSRKRMADGEVKARTGSMSPVKGHSRNTSTMSSELRTRLSYAMMKVNHGWQSNSLEEVENLASQGTSPPSSTSTIHRRHGSSASPRIPTSSAPTILATSPYEPPARQRRKSNSPPGASSSASSRKPGLAPPASIQPSMDMPAPRTNPRRNSNPHYTPTLLSHSHSASPRTPAQRMALQTDVRSRGDVDPILFSPHHTVREQDVAESLLFMSSPGNSANLKHNLAPTGSPGPQSQTQSSASSRNLPPRHALPGGPRKPLPSSSQRPGHHVVAPPKRTGLERSPMLHQHQQRAPGSPMDIDSSSQQAYQSGSVHGTPRPPRAAGANGSKHVRGALSLPSGLACVGGGRGGIGAAARKMLCDEDIERMLDRAGAEMGEDSSDDDEDIQIPRQPPRGGGVAGVLHV